MEFDVNKVIMSLPNPVWWQDTKAVFLGCNRAAARIFGLSSCSDIAGKTVSDLTKLRSWDKRLIRQFRQARKEILTEKRNKSFEVCFKKDNKTFLVYGLPIRKGRQEIIGVFYLGTDISSEKKIQQEQEVFIETIGREIIGKDMQQQFSIAEQTSWLRDFWNTIATYMPGYVFWKNKNSVYMGCNERIVELAGLRSRSEIAGKTDEEFGKKLGWDSNIADHIRRVDQQVIRSGRTNTNQEQLRNADGSTVILLTNKTPIMNQQGKPEGVLAVAIDITEQKQIEKDLKEAKEVAEQANQAKSNFLAVMSHELRTPLNAIMGMAQSMCDKGLVDKQLDRAKAILRASDHLLTLINDVLDFSKLEAGKLSLSFEEFNLRQIINDVITNTRYLLEDKDIKLITSYPKTAPNIVVADPRRVRQIIMNLVGNAVKFTRKGYIKLLVRHYKKSNKIKIIVEDTGIGIPKNKQSSVFERFTQVESKYTRKFSGTGLGLAICKQLIEDMQGEIGLKSVSRKGSKFWFTLPLTLKVTKKRIKHEANLVPDDSPIKPAHILLVEDVILNQMVMQDFLDDFGITLDIADHGKKALSMAEKNKYDLIFSDIGLPDISGLEVIQRLRAREKKGKHLPIIAMTAHALEEDRQACLKAGADDVITKPVEQPRLKAMLQYWLK